MALVKPLLLFLFAATLLNAAPIKIGVLGPFSGADSYWGIPYRNSVILAYEELGLTTDKIQLIFEDTLSEYPRVATGARKLVNIDRVDAIINTFDKASHIVAPVAAKARIPHLCLSLDSASDKKYTFTIWTPINKTVSMLLNKAREEQIHTLRLLVLRDYYPYRTEQEFDKQLKASYPDIKIVYREYFNPSERDFRTFALKAQQTPADLTIIVAYSPTVELLTKELVARGITKLSSIESFDQIQTGFNILPEGTWWAGAAENTPGFNSAYQKRFGEITFTGPTYGYDCLKLLAKAFELNREHPELALPGISIAGAGGETTLLREGYSDMPAYLKAWQNGKVVLLKKE